MLLVNMTIAARTCPKCGGKGRIKTPGVAGFGINPNRRTVCSRCGKTYDPGNDHWDDCEMCGSTGRLPDRGSSNDREMTDYELDLLEYLSPQEYNALQENLKMLQGYVEHIPCGNCNGTGKCNQCGGVMNFDFDNPNLCMMCGGTGICGICNGRCTQGTRIVRPTEEQKEQISKTVASFHELVKKRKEEKWGSISTGASPDPDIDDISSPGKDEKSTSNTSPTTDEEKITVLSEVRTAEKESNNNSRVLLGIAAVILGWLGYRKYRKTR